MRAFRISQELGSAGAEPSVVEVVNDFGIDIIWHPSASRLQIYKRLCLRKNPYQIYIIFI